MKNLFYLAISLSIISCGSNPTSSKNNTKSSLKMWTVEQCNTTHSNGYSLGTDSRGYMSYDPAYYTSTSCSPTYALWSIPVSDATHAHHVCLYGKQFRNGQGETEIKLTPPLDLIKTSEKVLSGKSFSAIETINTFRDAEDKAKKETLPTIGKFVLGGLAIAAVFSAIGGVPSSLSDFKINATQVYIPFSLIFSSVGGLVGVALNNRTDAEYDRKIIETELAYHPVQMTHRFDLDSGLLNFILKKAQTNQDGIHCPSLDEAKNIFIQLHHL